VAAKLSHFPPFKRSNSICSTNYAVLSLSVVKQPLVRRVPTTAIAFPLIAGIFTSRRVNTGTGAASEFTFFCRMSAFICPPKKDNMLQ
jgi:hypothetical protein